MFWATTPVWEVLILNVSMTKNSLVLSRKIAAMTSMTLVTISNVEHSGGTDAVYPTLAFARSNPVILRQLTANM